MADKQTSEVEGMLRDDLDQARRHLVLLLADLSFLLGVQSVDGGTIPEGVEERRDNALRFLS